MASNACRPEKWKCCRLFVSGNSVSDIARLLSRSTKTVSAQKISAMHKLEVTSDHGLLSYCIRAGEF